MHSILVPSTLQPFNFQILLDRYTLSVPLSVNELSLVPIASVKGHDAIAMLLIVKEIAFISLFAVLLVIRALSVQLSGHKRALTHERTSNSLNTMSFRLALHEFANIFITVRSVLASFSIGHTINELSIVSDAVSSNLLGSCGFASAEEAVYVALILHDLADLPFENSVNIVAFENGAVLVEYDALVLSRTGVPVTAEL